MAKALLIAILVSLQLPQAIAGSIAICFCSSGIVVADEVKTCRHCDGGCHSQSKIDLHEEDHDSSPGNSLARSEHASHESCADCLHLSLFAGDTLRSSVDLQASVDLTTDFDLPPMRAPIFSMRPFVAEDRVDFWDLQAGEAIALRC